tara:strand:+ start:1912 stop:2115 length:204 start_codon:yes stop_codon:yes gene_type:complete
MNEVIATIEEIESMLERKVEGPLTDVIEKKDIDPLLKEIYANLMILKLNAEVYTNLMTLKSNARELA